MNEAIREEVARFSRTTGIPCDLEICVPDTLTEQIAEIALRAVSEGLVNIARHAEATQASVRIISDDRAINIEIQDDGVGFDPEESVGRSGHYGLLGMRERARISGGALVIESDPSQGTILKLQLPLSSDND